MTLATRSNVMPALRAGDASSYFAHPMSDVQSTDIGRGTTIWQFTVVLPGARIGANCNICAGCFIENDVVLGDNVTIKNGVALFDGIRLEDDVFIGPNATFTNDRYPRSKLHLASHPLIVVERGASIGAAAVLLPGVRIGANALIGAGAVVTHDVPAGALVHGEPSRVHGRAPTRDELLGR